MTTTRFQDLALTADDRPWDGDEAEARLRDWAGAQDGPTPRYRDAHLWYDGDKPDNFTSYKLLIADVVNGELRAVPHGLRAAAGVLQGARGGVDIPADDADRVRAHLARYYDKMHDTAPFDE